MGHKALLNKAPNRNNVVNPRSDQTHSGRLEATKKAVRFRYSKTAVGLLNGY